MFTMLFPFRSGQGAEPNSISDCSTCYDPFILAVVIRWATRLKIATEDMNMTRL